MTAPYAAANYAGPRLARRTARPKPRRNGGNAAEVTFLRTGETKVSALERTPPVPCTVYRLVSDDALLSMEPPR